MGAGPLEPASTGPSDQAVVDDVLADLGLTRDDVRRKFAISERRAERLFALARSQMTDRDIINLLRPRRICQWMLFLENFGSLKVVMPSASHK